MNGKILEVDFAKRILCLVVFGSKGSWIYELRLTVMGLEEVISMTVSMRVESSEIDVLVRRSHLLLVMSKAFRHQPYSVARSPVRSDWFWW